ncbi:hypothetical protein ACVWW4_000261 [Bradyrhizobium sp. LB7.1]
MITPTSLLYPDAFLSPLALDEAVHRALDEDLGRAGDITSLATIPEATKAQAILVARQSGVIAGLPLALATLQKLSPEIEVRAHVRDAARVARGQQVLTISGPARAILAAERTALNFVGRLSGVATLTADYVARTEGTRMRICCTRKTTPGLRALKKYAVRCGGGFNHRFGLDDAILIKDNHIAVAGGIRSVLARAPRPCRPSRQDRDRGRHAGAIARCARHRPCRRRAARQHGHWGTARSRQAQRGTPQAGGIRRCHPGLHRSDRGDRRRLRLSRRADAFGAEFRLCVLPHLRMLLWWRHCTRRSDVD